jgi:hypothetical protein
LLLRGRCEEKQEEDGRVCQLENFLEQVSKFGFFAVFLQCTGLKIWIFTRFPAFFGGTQKNLEMRIFSAVSQDFEGQAHPKILHGFPTMNRFQNLDFPAVSCNF